MSPEIATMPQGEAIAGQGGKRSVSPEIRDLERFILSIKQSERKACTPKYYEFACSHEFHYRRVGCMHRDCPDSDCTRAVGSRRASRARKRLDAGRKGRAVCQTVLTVPPELREKFVDRVEWRAALKAMHQILHEKFGAMFAVECSHPWGDKDPSRFHPHANFLWVSNAGPFVSVERLQREWGNVLRSVRLPVVYHQYSYKREQIAHLIRYVTRDFVGFSKWCGSMRWYGDYPPRPNIPLRCPVCHSTYMYLRKLTVGEYEERLAEQRLADDPFP